MRVHLALVGDHGPEALVFPADKSADGMRPFHAEAFGRQWRKALATVDGLPDGLVFHDLRHTGNTLAAGTGASPRHPQRRPRRDVKRVDHGWLWAALCRR